MVSVLEFFSEARCWVFPWRQPGPVLLDQSERENLGPDLLRRRVSASGARIRGPRDGFPFESDQQRLVRGKCGAMAARGGCSLSRGRKWLAAGPVYQQRTDMLDRCA